MRQLIGNARNESKTHATTAIRSAISNRQQIIEIDDNWIEPTLNYDIENKRGQNNGAATNSSCTSCYNI